LPASDLTTGLAKSTSIVSAAVEHQRHSIAILNIGGMDRYAQQQAERIDEDMALATRDFLARYRAFSWSAARMSTH
jgi:hypothetical protein